MFLWIRFCGYTLLWKYLCNQSSFNEFQTRNQSAMSGERPSISNFDDVLTSVSSFGYWQKIIYVATCCLVIIPSSLQVIGLVFFAGTPRFHCVTPNVTCADSKCCTNCTDYVFDGPFTSSVSEVSLEWCMSSVIWLSHIFLGHIPEFFLSLIKYIFLSINDNFYLLSCI